MKYLLTEDELKQLQVDTDARVEKVEDKLKQAIFVHKKANQEPCAHWPWSQELSIIGHSTEYCDGCAFSNVPHIEPGKYDWVDDAICPNAKYYGK